MLISPDARVDRSAQLGSDVHIGAFSVVHAGVSIGSGSRIGSFCEIGGGAQASAAPVPRLVIGEGANIRSHSIVYAGSTIGANFESGHRVTIRERTLIGVGVRVGTQCDVQGDCQIASRRLDQRSDPSERSTARVRDRGVRGCGGVCLDSARGHCGCPGARRSVRVCWHGCTAGHGRDGSAGPDRGPHVGREVAFRWLGPCLPVDWTLSSRIPAGCRASVAGTRGRQPGEP
jgi:carbonic anhydrase/acetyltransferase-like protein (isoleucine patch superfamily)